jgi:phosphopantothenoylcysteine decarboxylase / phosphopantothenate---cysteine ligase
LSDEVVMITAGPTVEDIDPVRFLTNRSSGKMGYALAEAAQRRGARVVLVSGPTSLTVPEGVDWVPVRTTAEMHKSVMEHAAESTVIIKAAAVADYRPVAPASQKIKRTGRMALELEPTEDILAELGSAASGTSGPGGERVAGSGLSARRILVGFAAETDAVAENARGKLMRKGADMIVANDVTQEGAGFDVQTNVVTIFLQDGREVALPKLTKFEVANKILDQILELRQRNK